jgi:Zn-dependent M16 (insulinase) family peptidase
MTEFILNNNYHGFTLERMELIPDIQSTVYLFRHDLLGTPALAIKNDDPNKTFCIAFQTVPDDSTGVAHILEHSVLMGSKKYPVHDVFGEINKGGLMTFLNAMTGSDTTWYPFATRNMAEYFNIMDVYCDVTLNPLLLRSTFEQEGWRYHKESAEAPLEFQGVVFNEMKGAFSDPIRSIFHNMFSGLMPESTYAHESGGDPANIPDLSYEQFKAFHKLHYHPSNSFIFFYGDADLEQELTAVQDNFLSAFSEPGSKAEIVQGNGISVPVHIDETYAVQPGSELTEKTYLAVGTAVGTVLNRRRNAAFQIIANILFNSDASPLKKEIIEAGLCKDFGGLFLPTACYQTFMMTYLIGSDPDKKEQFLALYQHSLAAMVEDGIDHDLVLSELNSYEFSLREELTKAQRGLDLISKALPALKHGTDPFAALQINSLLKEIRHKALEESYFEQLIREYLLENPSTAVVTLIPDPDKMAQTLACEQQRLAAYEQSLSREQLTELVNNTQKLLQLQQTGNDDETLALLPRLARTDLDRAPDFHQIRPETVDCIPFLINELDTNSVTYIQLGLDCSSMDKELLPFLDLFATIATELGTTSRDYVAFAKDVNIFTGGLSHSFSTYRIKEQPLQTVLWFKSKALSQYLPETIDIMCDVMANLDLSNRQRIREIVQREFTWFDQTVQSEGYSLASSRVFSHLSESGMIHEHLNGATAFFTLKRLAMDYSAGEDDFLDKLESLKKCLFQPEGLQIAVTGSADDVAVVKQYIQQINNSLQGTADRSGAATPYPRFPKKQAFCNSAEVVYNVRGCCLFQDGRGYKGNFEVLKTWLSRDFLWNTVRQIGGAYGCFVHFHHITGNCALISYRDPQISKTYETYSSIADAVQELELSQANLDQLIIGTYGNFTPHQSPAALGQSARNEYLSGITPEFKQQRIVEIIDTTVDSIRSYANALRNFKDKSFSATIGNPDKIKEHAELFDDITDL